MLLLMDRGLRRRLTLTRRANSLDRQARTRERRDR